MKAVIFLEKYIILLRMVKALKGGFYTPSHLLQSMIFKDTSKGFIYVMNYIVS